MGAGAYGACVQAGGGGGLPPAAALAGVLVFPKVGGGGGDATAECVPTGVGRGRGWEALGKEGGAHVA
jgi:hypothetical protein